MIEFFYLDEDLSDGDKGGTELCCEQAADKEITQTSSEELRTRISSLTMTPNLSDCKLTL